MSEPYRLEYGKRNNPLKEKICQECRRKFESRSNRVRWCPGCRDEQYRRSCREYHHANPKKHPPKLPRNVTCKVCGAKSIQKGVGRNREYCDNCNPLYA